MATPGPPSRATGTTVVVCPAVTVHPCLFQVNVTVRVLCLPCWVGLLGALCMPRICVCLVAAVADAWQWAPHRLVTPPPPSSPHRRCLLCAVLSTFPVVSRLGFMTFMVCGVGVLGVGWPRLGVLPGAVEPRRDARQFREGAGFLDRVVRAQCATPPPRTHPTPCTAAISSASLWSCAGAPP
jgi:hypothetical protein